MKKFLTSLLSFITAFALLSCAGDTLPIASSSSAESTYESFESEASSDQPASEEGSENSSFFEESASEETSERDSSSSEEETLQKEEDGDLATTAPIRSRAPQNYGTHNILSIQSETVSENSTAALKGVFNSIDAPVYKDYMIWTWASLCLGEHFNQKVDLKGKALTYDVKTENCGLVSSFIVVDPSGNRTEEVSFMMNSPAAADSAISVMPLSNGWTRVTVDFFLVYFDSPVITDASELLIMFTNQDCSNPNADSVFYIDNMKLTDSSSDESSSDITVFNPEGYYKKTTPLSVKVVGNSFVSNYYSASAYFLQYICEELDIPLTATALSIGNGRIPDQHNAAFGSQGYMYHEKIDVLFIQDFYATSDMTALGAFLTELYKVSPFTELKVYAGENETRDGYRAACYYGVDHVDWRNAVKTLKTNYGYGQEHLNASDGWHPNYLSGFIGGLMMYMELYGEQPDFEAVKRVAQEWVWHYLPGEDDETKKGELSTIYTVAASYVLN